MSKVSKRYRRRAEEFESKVASVDAGAWANQSPCPEWTTKDVVKHVVESTNHFLAMVELVPTDAPDVDADPVASWQATRSAVQSALDDVSIAEKMVESSMGDAKFEDLVDRYLCFDLVIHTWDVARAAGVDDSLDAATVHDARLHAENIVEMGRKMGAFGPEVDITDKSNEQAHLLALVGRTY